MSKDLTPEKARIFRIIHRCNLQWILENGLHCANSEKSDPNFIPIGNPDLIQKRTHRRLPIEDLNNLDWDILQRRDFRTDPDDPAKRERYQAEALVRDILPVSALLGVGCYNDVALAAINKDIAEAGVPVKAAATPD